ncbi:MAG: hypothetical protein QOI24_4290 [Acidobacteriota bacterium]|nr:hypothetical protein [Acidobacteriota bacterium]
MRAGALTIAVALFSFGSAQSATVTVSSAASLPPDCSLHVADDGAAEQSAPCTTVLQTTGKHAVAWVETSSLISRFVTDVTKDATVSASNLVPRGTVSFPGDRELRPGERIRLISLIAQEPDAASHPLFVRDVTSTRETPAMPAAKIVAILLDAKGRAVGVSPRMAVLPGATSTLWPERPKRGDTIVALFLSRPSTSPKRALDVAMADSAGSQHPSELVDGSDALFAIWYALTGPSARLILESHDYYIPQEQVDAQAGSVTLIERSLRPLPTLKVAIGSLLQRKLRDTPAMSLELTATGSEASVKSMSVEPGKVSTFERMPVALLMLDLHIGEFVLQKQLDLTTGDDTTISIPLEPLIVSGTVYRGETPMKARISFMQKGTPLTTDTDDFGAFEITLWQPRRYIVETTPADRPSSPPFSQDVAITASTKFDIHVPAGTIVARVFDAADGKPIAEATVMVRNKWVDGKGSSSSVTSVAATGELTELPPQRTGTSEIQAFAPGYESATPVVINVDETTSRVVVPMPMKRGENVHSLQITIAGRPAAGAEIATFSGERMVWHSVADETGHLSLPEQFEGMRLIIRHPDAATEVILSPGDRIPLTPPAPPLVVRVVHRDETTAGPAPATLTLRGMLTGAEAGFATWSLGATGPDGTVTLRGLLPQPLRIMATQRTSADKVRKDDYYRTSTIVPFPWPAVVTLTLADE